MSAVAIGSRSPGSPGEDDDPEENEPCLARPPSNGGARSAPPVQSSGGKSLHVLTLILTSLTLAMVVMLTRQAGGAARAPRCVEAQPSAALSTAVAQAPSCQEEAEQLRQLKKNLEASEQLRQLAKQRDDVQSRAVRQLTKQRDELLTQVEEFKRATAQTNAQAPAPALSGSQCPPAPQCPPSPQCAPAPECPPAPQSLPAATPPARAPSCPGAVPDFAQVLIYKGLPDLGKKGETHSQFGQDWFVSTVLGCKRGGFYLDLAANDYMELSNTLMLERDFGWGGVCIEANSGYIYGLAKRRCQLVVGAIGAPKNEKVQFLFNGDKGGIVGKGPNADRFFNKRKNKDGVKELYLVEFGEVLAAVKAPPVIDFMSLDVEGAEEIVMQTFPWSKHTIMIMTIERPKKELKAKLEKNGYQELRGNHNGDEFWVHKSLPGLDQVVRDWGTRNQFPATSCMEKAGYARPNELAVSWSGRQDGNG